MHRTVFDLSTAKLALFYVDAENEFETMHPEHGHTSFSSDLF